MILLAGRMAIPQELYEAAAVDGATGLRRFAHVTFPLLANLYLVCTLLDMIFALGDFNSTFFVSGGGPAMSTEVLATLGIRYAFTVALPRLGVAAVMSALPLLIPLVIILMRKLRTVGGAAVSAHHGRPAGSIAVRRCTTGCSAMAVEAACLALGFVLVVWSLTPIYNMWMIALDSHDDIFSGDDLAGEARRSRASASSSPQDFWYLEHFWHQFGNSFYRRPDR